MPLAAVQLALPPDAREVHAADADGDGRDDLIVVCATVRPGSPDAVKLAIWSFSAAGVPGTRRDVDLGTRPMLWDAKAGLWGIDREGFVRFDLATGATARIAKFPTALAGLGPSTPAHAPFAHDLDGDGAVELVAWSAGRYLAIRADGTAMGSVPAPAGGTLAVDWSVGAAATRATLETPALTVVDLDGDGKRDLLLPRASKLAAYFTGAELGARAASVPLPLDLKPPRRDPRPGETVRGVSAVWIEDLDGDGRVDLGVQHDVASGSWFGATAELSWARGRGDGFGALTTLPLSASAFRVKTIDVDGDGDRDIVAPLVDTGLGTLARALVARQVRVDLSLLRMVDGAYQPPVVLRALSFPLENSDRLQVDFGGDLDGDERTDLVTNDGEDRVRVYRGRDGGVESAPAWDHALRVPLGDDTIFVHDLTGDGRAEVLVWGPGEGTAVVLRVP